jgi:hypothetical protein
MRHVFGRNSCPYEGEEMTGLDPPNTKSGPTGSQQQPKKRKVVM